VLGAHEAVTGAGVPIGRHVADEAEAHEEEAARRGEAGRRVEHRRPAPDEQRSLAEAPVLAKPGGDPRERGARLRVDVVADPVQVGVGCGEAGEEDGRPSDEGPRRARDRTTHVLGGPGGGADGEVEVERDEVVGAGGPPLDCSARVEDARKDATSAAAYVPRARRERQAAHHSGRVATRNCSRYAAARSAVSPGDAGFVEYSRLCVQLQ
jgi:hypothetical protein